MLIAVFDLGQNITYCAVPFLQASRQFHCCYRDASNSSSCFDNSNLESNQLVHFAELFVFFSDLVGDEFEVSMAFPLVPGETGNGSLLVRGTGLDTDDTSECL